MDDNADVKAIWLLITIAILFPVAISADTGDNLFPLADYLHIKLQQNDIVFLGTTHKKPEILSFIAELIPALKLSASLTSVWKYRLTSRKELMSYRSGGSVSRMETGNDGFYSHSPGGMFGVGRWVDSLLVWMMEQWWSRKRYIEDTTGFITTLKQVVHATFKHHMSY